MNEEYVELAGDDGKVHSLRFSIRAIMWMERQSGETFGAITQGWSNGDWSMAQVVWCVAAGIMHEHPKAKSLELRNMAIDIVEQIGFQPAMKAVGTAIEASAFVKGAERPDPNAGDPDLDDLGNGTGTT